ncbi:MAG TPA: hypothetical protein VER58_18480 [Thermoanaerobaculia bacterium]|nr:hypothetical protein [Thermoanaerobaculia bacterium]
MKSTPTYDDANLILRLYDLRREEKLRAARKWFGAMPALNTREEFLKICPVGTEENAYFRMVTTFWEMAASFVETGVLNRELFYRANNMELLFVWEKIKRFVPEQRAAIKDPLRYKQMEDVANGFIEYLNQNAPGFYENWAAGIARTGQPVGAASR